MDLSRRKNPARRTAILLRSGQMRCHIYLSETGQNLREIFDNRGDLIASTTVRIYIVAHIGERIVIRVADATDPWLFASFGQPLGVLYGQILSAAIRPVNQVGFGAALGRIYAEIARSKCDIGDRILAEGFDECLPRGHQR